MIRRHAVTHSPAPRARIRRETPPMFRGSFPGGGLLVLAVLTAGLSPAGCEKTPPHLSGMGVDSAFAAVVVPVLRDQCKDCHFPGGPMYRDMPFDNIGTVSGLGDEVTVRLDGDGREVVARWMSMMRAGREAAADSSLP